MFNGSWKTTLTGAMGIIIAAWSNIVQPVIDNDVLTNPDFTAFMAAATVALGLIFARDNDVTSRQAGAE